MINVIYQHVALTLLKHLYPPPPPAVVPPKFTRPLKGYNMQLPGTDLTMECQAEGLPTPQMSWYKDGAPYPPSDMEDTERFSFNSDKTRYVGGGYQGELAPIVTLTNSPWLHPVDCRLVY